MLCVMMENEERERERSKVIDHCQNGRDLVTCILHITVAFDKEKSGWKYILGALAIGSL